MNIENYIQSRSEGKCELCDTTENIDIYTVPPTINKTIKNCIHACSTCLEQIKNPEKINANHWRCLNNSMWSTEPAIQVIAWRMLNKLKDERWAHDLLDNIYLDEETLAWAKNTDENEIIKHLDSNGIQLQIGDTVILTKDLNVKGANFTAKRGTAVRNISLVADNAEQIEGKVNGQHIVILTKFVKK